METNNLINQAVLSIGSTPPTSGDQKSEKRLFRVDGQLLTVPELLWKRMTGLYAHKWTGAYGVDPTPEWEMALDCLTPEMVRTGLDRTVSERWDWPPNPIQFRELCLPTSEDLGLPSDDDAFQQAVGNATDKDPSVIYTLRNMGDEVYKFRRCETEKARKLFKKHWDKTIEYVMTGGELPEPELQVEDRPVRASKGRGS